MFREDLLASRTRVECLEVELRQARNELAHAREGKSRAEEALRRAREGLGHDPDLQSDGRYRRARLALLGLSALGSVATITGIVQLSSGLVAPPLLTRQGVTNFWFHVRQGDGLVGMAAAAGVVLLASPLFVLPWLAAVGLRHERRWGWFLAVASSCLYLFTPLSLPVACYVLIVLWSGRVRSLYFPRG